MGQPLESAARAVRVVLDDAARGLVDQELLAGLDALAAAAGATELAGIRSRLAEAVRMLRGAGIALTDRRVVKLQRLIAAAAALDGRTVASDADLWPIIYAVPASDAQALAREVLRPILASSTNATLGAAAAEASLSPAARAARLVDAARVLLAAKPQGELAVWHGKLESVAREVAREIDAGFAADARPQALAEARAASVAVLAEERARTS